MSFTNSLSRSSSDKRIEKLVLLITFLPSSVDKTSSGFWVMPIGHPKCFLKYVILTIKMAHFYEPNY